MKRPLGLKMYRQIRHDPKQVYEELLAGLGLLLATFASGVLLAIWKVGLGDTLAFLAGLELAFLFYAAHLYFTEKRRAPSRA